MDNKKFPLKKNYLFIGNPFDSKMFVKNFISYYDDRKEIDNMYVFGYEKRDIKVKNISKSFFTPYINNTSYHNKIDNFEKNVGFFLNRETSLSKLIVIRLKNITDVNKTYINFIAQSTPFVNATLIFVVDIIDKITKPVSNFIRNFINFTFINYNEHSITKLKQFIKMNKFPEQESILYKVM